MKTFLLAGRTFLPLFLFFFAINCSNLAAQDPAVQSIDVPGPQVFSNQATPVAATIFNPSPVPANGVLVQISVKDNDLMTVFFWQTTIPGIPPFGLVLINTMPQTWYPDMPGNYQVMVQVFSPEDEDPSNNMANQAVTAIQQPPITMEQVDMVAPFQIPNSMYGMFCIVTTPWPDPYFVNVMANDPNGTGTDWVVRNLPLLPFPEPQTICYWFDLRLLNFEPGDDVASLNYTMRLDPETLPEPFPVPQWSPITVAPFEYNVSDNNAAEILLMPPLTVTFPIFGSSPLLTWTYRGCTIPNIDLDSMTYNPTTVPGYAGDKNACGPAAAANSLQWLQDTHPDIPNDGNTHRQKMQSLSGHMGRGTEDGVTTEQLVQGKLGYIDEHKLPIHVKFQSAFVQDSALASPNGNYGHSAENKGNQNIPMPPTWEFLKSEMEKGEDVEIMFGWYDQNGNRHGGHWVTVTGVSENPFFKGIFIKDDLKQDTAGGTRQKYLHWHTQGDWSRLVGFDGPNSYCWVESVVSESYDPTITFLAFDFKLEMLDWINPFATPDPSKAFFTFSYPPSLDTGYLNVMANLPAGPSVWMARNVLLPPRDTIETVTLWWDLADMGLLPNQVVDSVDIGVGVDSVVWNDSFFDVFYSLPVDLDTIPYRVGIGAPEISPVTVPFVPLLLLPYDSLIPTTFVYRGCEVPNIDLDSTSMNPVTMPGYAGDKNACGPAGAANSLQWLEDTHPDIPDSGTSHRDKLKELSEMMDRADNSGVYRMDFIEAKLEFIDKYKLPIHVKFQGFRFGTDDISSPDTLYGHAADNQNAAANAKPQWDWLVQEMENGEDVEVEFGYYDENGNRQGGHWVTATGVTEVGGVRSLYFKDDTDQIRSGGMRHGCTAWVTLPSGHSYLKDLSGSEYVCVVETVVSESYDPTITFCPDDLTLNQDPIPSGTYSASQVIYLSGKVAAGSSVTLSAPNIILQSQFTVEVGATLTTNTAGCQ